MTSKPLSKAFLAIALVLFALPMFLGFFARSHVPVFFDRYSPFLLLQNLLNGLLFLLGVFLVVRNSRPAPRIILSGLLVFSSFTIGGNNVVKDTPHILLVLALIRFFLGAAVLCSVHEEFDERA